MVFDQIKYARSLRSTHKLKTRFFSPPHTNFCIYDFLNTDQCKKVGLNHCLYITVYKI